MDHNVSTRTKDGSRIEATSRIQMETLANNCRDSGITLYDFNDANQGVVHIIGAELGINREEYLSATVLLTRDNFGCGSSREHAPWALADYGFRVIIAPSFADIFYSNCVKNGILPVTLKPEAVGELFNEVSRHIGTQVTADLEHQTVETSGGRKYSFPVDAFSKHCLLEGLDHIGWTLQFGDKIDAFEKRLKQQRPRL